MDKTPNDAAEASFSLTDFEQITTLVSTEFQIEEALLEHNIPTYYLKQPQETKNAFLRLLKNLEAMNLMAILRRRDGRIVLKTIPKSPTKPSNILVNWLLLFATVGTTFITGYMISPRTINPFVSGATFTIAIMAVFGLHEMGHKLTADRRNVDATPPYFIPAPPPIGGVSGIGTFGAVIMQKSLPQNRDSLFDIGVTGPLVGFVASVIVTFIGLALSSSVYRLPTGPFGSVPLLFRLVGVSLNFLGIYSPGNIILPHPIAFAGFIGMIVTMLNLLPVGMLDGGHVAVSILGEKMRSVLTLLSLVFLIINEYYSMAVFVVFLSLFKHPGPLDDVSSLSKVRKCIIPALLIIFALCGIMTTVSVYRIKIDSSVQGIPFQIYFADSMYYSNKTSWETLLAEGNYIVCFPLNFTKDSTVYFFYQWEDGTTNPNRTILLDHDISIMASYKNSITAL